MRGFATAAAALALVLTMPLAAPARSADQPRDAEILTFDALDGWAEEDFAAAFATFTATCSDLGDIDWAAVCAFAATDPDPKRFFELFFRPVRMGRNPALFTGYFEPELRASSERTPYYRHPVYARPPELQEGTGWLTRAEIENGDVLTGRGLEIAWLRDPVDLYYLQIQGSGRLKMADGSVIRIGYAGRNGHARRPVSSELVRRGIYEPHQVSARVIRNWVRRNPESGRDLLQHDPSYVFFRVLENHSAESGPLGAMNRPLTPLRSIAVDPAHVPLGAPVWIEKNGEAPMRRLMIAQDTGGAIKGPQRADIYFGTGADAERAAETVRDSGRMVVLLPIEQAFALAMEG